MISYLTDLFRDKKAQPLACIKEIKRIGQVTIVRFCGRIDSTTIPDIDKELEKHEERNFDRNILLDFKSVTHVDSATLAYIIVLLDRIQTPQKKIGVINTSVLFDDLVAVKKMGSIIHRYSDEENALNDLT